MIKLLIPMMPTADDLLPYLRRIDANKVYVNGGELVRELETLLSKVTGVHCAVVSNGTLALELALKATCQNMHRKYDVVLPALTFCATGLAVHNAGLLTNFCDVNSDSWQITPSLLHDYCDSNRIIGELAAVMPVAAFGKPVKTMQWENYLCPVIIDAAGAFPEQMISYDQNIITCFSLHATKFIGCGEGGIVASNNRNIIGRVKNLSTFGENGTNAKMSEYHAAVTLASLNYDFVAKKQAKTRQIANWYAEELRRLPRNLKISEYGCNSTMLNILLPISANEVIEYMASKDIETKQWYRPYLYERDDFTATNNLPVTDNLRDHLVGLPFHTELTQSDVSYIVDTLRKVLL